MTQRAMRRQGVAVLTAMVALSTGTLLAVPATAAADIDLVIQIDAASQSVGVEQSSRLGLDVYNESSSGRVTGTVNLSLTSGDATMTSTYGGESCAGPDTCAISLAAGDVLHLPFTVTAHSLTDITVEATAQPV